MEKVRVLQDTPWMASSIEMYRWRFSIHSRVNPRLDSQMCRLKTIDERCDLFDHCWVSGLISFLELFTKTFHIFYLMEEKCVLVRSLSRIALSFRKSVYLGIRSKGTKSTLSAPKMESRNRLARVPAHIPHLSGKCFRNIDSLKL